MNIARHKYRCIALNIIHKFSVGKIHVLINNVSMVNGGDFLEITFPMFIVY